MRIWLNESHGIEFDPPLSDVEEGVLEGMEYVHRTMDAIPQIESVLFSPSIEQLLGLQPPPPRQQEVPRLGSGFPEVKVGLEQAPVDETIADLKSFMSQCFANATEFLHHYDKYMFMFSDETARAISEFFQVEHTFDEYTKVR